ncbi:MAG: hypothetical protein BWY31_04764 [Lentisphaerae bacterium ADurb.Bin242]|nr:MAG: hypothetical protein BWY31_04764 [Lentisphaerae bacterium ADurb.Bin242]
MKYLETAILVAAIGWAVQPLRAEVAAREEQAEGRRLMVLENAHVRLAVLPDPGATVVEFINKKTGHNFVAGGDKVLAGRLGWGWEDYYTLEALDQFGKSVYSLPYTCEFRDAPGGKTLKTCRFDALADKHGAFLLSPGFRGPKYREPEVWSGKFLKSAVAELEKKYKLKPQKLLFYGYAEGGECANRFYFWMPERVRAWGAHDCTGYSGKSMRNPFPALVTRGDGNRSLLEAEQRFIVGYRSAGGSLLRKNFPGAGRDWGTGSLELARLWLDAVLSEERVQEYGEDETLRVVPVSRKKDIETEYRNPFYNSKIRDLWLR